MGGTTQLGHYISEQGPVNAATTSRVRQTVDSDIVIGDSGATTGTSGVEGAGPGVGNSLTLTALAGGRTEIGHRSPGTNNWEAIGSEVVTVQTLAGDITLEVGTDADQAAATGAIDGNDDLAIVNLGGVAARIGHNHTDVSELTGNQVQSSVGDIWVEVGADLHLTGGQIGHEHYDFATTAVNTANAGLGSGTARNRIAGNTTIGAGQNSPRQDSTLIANMVSIDALSAINSGYGGVGNKDVGGQLRFFMPAQENLTIIGSPLFNDSGSSGDATAARTADPTNVFQGQGGKDHEHPFTLMSSTALYSKQGPGNYGFYFEAPPPAGQPDFTPYINWFDADDGFAIEQTSADRSRRGCSAVNSGSLDGSSYIGTSSLSVDMEDGAGAASGMCGSAGASEHYHSPTPGFGSNIGYSGLGSSNAINNDAFLTDDVQAMAEPRAGYQYSGRVVVAARTSSTVVALARVSDRVTVEAASAMTYGTGLKPQAVSMVFTPLETLGVPVVTQYVRNQDDAGRQLHAAFPHLLSYASSYDNGDEKL